MVRDQPARQCYSAPVTEAMQPPTYDDVVQRYGLKILAKGADLVLTPKGGLATTKTGGAMLGSVEFSAMFRLVHGWRFNEPTLRFLFGRVFAIRHRLRERTTTGDEIAAHKLGAIAYAGAVVLVLDRLLQAFRDDMDGWPEWHNSEPLIRGHSIGAILWASANNFRHNDEWLKKRGHPTQQQLKSIRVLADALEEPIGPDGANHKLSRHVCQDTLQLLSGESFSMLGRRFFAFANSMVQRRVRA